MKKLAILFCVCVLTQINYSQNLIIDDSITLKKGIYQNFKEFKFNSPTIPFEYEILTSDNQIYKLKIDKTKTDEIGPIWGFCDGTNIYINTQKDMRKRLVFNPNSQFNKILFLGRYCYFLGSHFTTNNMYYFNMPYVIDFNTGEELCLICDPDVPPIKKSQFHKIVSLDDELWSEYKNEKSKMDNNVIASYIKLYSIKHKDEVK